MNSTDVRKAIHQQPIVHVLLEDDWEYLRGNGDEVTEIVARVVDGPFQDKLARIDLVDESR
jgi:hypothetical protein